MNRVVANCLKSLAGWLPRRRLAPAAAIRKARVPHTDLREVFENSAIASEPDRFALYRIIGNDLHPRHRLGQSLDNLAFILRNEPALEGCEKRWVVNRVVDRGIEAKIIALLREHEQPFIHIPFLQEEYAKIGFDLDCLPWRNFLESRRFRRLKEKDKNRIRVAVYRLKNNYVMNNNGARNAALKEGRRLAKWVLPFDGNCFFTTAAWNEFTRDVKSSPWLKHFAVPMARILENDQLMDPAFAPSPVEEPQLAFRQDSTVLFNEAFPYGRRPKAEMFWHLGIPGPWDLWKEKPWDQPRRPLSAEACSFGVAGWVARLFSGVSPLEAGPGNMPEKRGVARQQAILTLLDTLDCQIAEASAEIRPRQADDLFHK